MRSCICRPISRLRHSVAQRSSPEDAATNTNKHMVRFIRELITNGSFKLYVGKDSLKTYTIKNGVHQGSVLAPMLFNIYMYGIPKTASIKYSYASDIALMESGLNYAEIQQTLTNDLTNMDMYLQRWRLRLNVEKTVSSCFHLTNCMAKHQMEVSCGGNTIPTTYNPKYLGVTLDRSLTYTKHLSQLSMKVNAWCNFLRRLAGTKWGAHFDVLHTSTSLAFAPAEYCSSVWCRSAHTHRRDASLNNDLRLVSGCIRSTPTFMLPVVSGIMPPDIRRNKQCLALSRRAEADDQHALHNIVTASTPGRKRLQSRQPPFLRACKTTHQRRSRKDQQDVGRWDLGNEMEHHMLPIMNVHPNSIKQTHRT